MCVIEITTRGTTVSVDNGLLRIGAHTACTPTIWIWSSRPLPAVTITGDALALLGGAGIALVICDQRRMPISQLAPSAGGAVLAPRTLQLQAAMTPRRRRTLWRQIVRRPAFSWLPAVELVQDRQLVRRREYPPMRVRRHPHQLR